MRFSDIDIRYARTERVTALVLVHTLRVQLRISSRLRVVRLSVRDDGIGGASPRRSA
jgi:hypothetical protein